jgi:hypothetical protein
MHPDDIEQWRPVARADSYYDVSDFGRVRRAKPGRGTYAGKILVVTLPRTRSHYSTVVLSVGGVPVTQGVHVLVAEAFLDPRPTPRHEVNHRDGVKTNNRITNLEWVTRSSNQTHSNAIGLVSHPKGEQKTRAKLTDAAVREIRAASQSISARTLARHYGVSHRTLYLARIGRTWKHVD